jgi:tetratricopeptide (TPR) repeat protein
MKHWMTRGCLVALFGVAMLVPGWSQQDQGGAGKGEGQAEPGTPAAPQVSKEELAAYNKWVAENKTAKDARQRVTLGEAFVATYPNSTYAGVVYGNLAPAYLELNEPDKMLDAGSKALASDPNNVDVLPLMAWAIPRRSGMTAQQLEQAVNYAQRAINLLSTMPKPPDLDDAMFTKIKNEKLAQCHSGLGTAYFKTGNLDKSVAELTQAVQLDPMPDPVDYYVLGLGEERGNHFTAAIDAFNKCSAQPGPLVSQCKQLSSETTKKKATTPEAP